MSSKFYARQSHARPKLPRSPHHTTHMAFHHPTKYSVPTSRLCYHGGISKPARSRTQYISDSLRLKLQCTIKNAWQTSTLHKYKSGINRFIAFCVNENIPSTYRLPASEFLLCAFAASSAGLRAGDTISSDLSAVRAWHIVNNVHYNGGLQLKYTVKGARNMTPGSSKRPL
jgi:hypothetical protein